MLLIIRLLCFISGLLLSLPSYSASLSGYPLTITDASNHKITLSQAPKRISSKSMFNDQVIINLLPATRITSLTWLSKDPSYSIIANKIPAGIPLLDLNIEQIIAEQPDLVLAAKWSDKQKIQILRAAGINVFITNPSYTLSDIEHNILTLGQLLDSTAQAKKLVAEMNSKLEQQRIKPTHRLSAVEYTPWGASSNRNSSINTIIEQAGLNNVIASLKGDQYGQVPVSKEQLIALNPDIIIIPGTYAEDNSSNHNGFRDQLLNDPSLQGLKAIRNHQIIEIPPALRATNSQYIVDAILYLNKKVYSQHHD